MRYKGLLREALFFVRPCMAPHPIEGVSPLQARSRHGGTYEACIPDEEANISKVQYLYGRYVRICGGHKREGGSALSGKV